MLWGNQRGQMAIFIALFFQVIFVFFAMAINVGLVVHDKINLQNSVDIAAYYGAMKQAEVLNQIAHINYQMRQNYKIFAWRYRVLGTLGNENHPLNSIYSGANNSLRPEDPAWQPTMSPVPPNKITPSVCVAHSWFREVQEVDPNAATVCEKNDFSLPAIPSISPPSGFVPGSGSLPGTIAFIQGQLNKFCWEAGIFNWFFAARALVHFRTEGLARKNMIWRLANNLSQGDPLDLKGQSIREGVKKTFERNLTQTNLGSIQGGTGQFNYMNSMAVGQCNDPTFWLPEIKINPIIFFSDWDVDGSKNCQPAQPIPNRRGIMTGRPSGPGGADNLPSAFRQANFSAVWNGALAQGLKDHWFSEPSEPASQPGYHSSVGYEKNPWCMVYTGVQATTLVRKPFDPTGQGIQLTAHGFAKPFGGRIGPWYGKQWPRGGAASSANSRNEMVDPLLPSRDITGAAANPYDDVVNYSRYPGDPLGLNSYRAMSAMIGAWKAQVVHANPIAASPIAFVNYDTLGRINLLTDTGDGLPRPGKTKSGVEIQPVQRKFELAAGAPDLFDATYFSIEPRYYRYYWSSRATGSGASFSGIQPLWDIGSTKDNFTFSNLSGAPDYSVTDQINLANNSNPSEGTYNADYEPVLRNWQHLLNSWHQQGVVTFGLDPARFGRCSDSITKVDYPMPSDCIRGGRVGYSVKLISRDFLESSDYQLGGGGGGGALLNAPSMNGF